MILIYQMIQIHHCTKIFVSTKPTINLQRSYTSSQASATANFPCEGARANTDCDRTSNYKDSKKESLARSLYAPPPDEIAILSQPRGEVAA